MLNFSLFTNKSIRSRLGFGMLIFVNYIFWVWGCLRMAGCKFNRGSTRGPISRRSIRHRGVLLDSINRCSSESGISVNTSALPAGPPPPWGPADFPNLIWMWCFLPPVHQSLNQSAFFLLNNWCTDGKNCHRVRAPAKQKTKTSDLSAEIVFSHKAMRRVLMTNFTPSSIKSTPFITSLKCGGRGQWRFHSSYRFSIFAVISIVLICACGQICPWVLQ